MNNKVGILKNELPTLQDLVKNVQVYEKHDELNFLLNQEPPKKWIKEHPYIRGHKYIPIDKVEYLLRKIFKEYRIEILREGTSFNGVFVVARLHYKNLVDDSWSYHDGIGATQLQTAKGTSPADLNNINNGALSMGYPLAKTLAIKDAADMFGKLFGSDLNRRDTLPASMDKPKRTVPEKSNLSLIKTMTLYNKDYVLKELKGEFEDEYNEKILELNKK